MIGKLNFIWEDKAFLKKTAGIALPIALQSLLNTVVNFVDTLMIGQLGETSIAAVGLANKVFFVFVLLVFGIVSGSGILTAQYWGKRDIPNIRRVLGMSLILSTLVSILFLVPSRINPEFVMSIFTDEKDTIKIGATYLMIVAISYPFTAVTNAYVTMLRGVNRVKAPVIITSISILVNVIFNYLLIYGKFGFPEMGVAGAAIATVLARIVECAALLCIVYGFKGPAAAKPKELFTFSKGFLRKYFGTVTPVIANELVWGLGVTLYSVAYGRMGKSAVAAITITQTVEQITQVAFMGISNAAAVILGNEMGAGHLKSAEKHAKSLIWLQLILTIGIAVIGFLASDAVISLFVVSEQVAQYFKLCFTVYILYMPFKTFNFINVVGILRSGGDTKACLFLDCTGVWLIGIPMAFIGGLFLQLPIYIVYAMVMVEEIYKFIFGMIRYRQKKWLRNIVASDF